MIRRHTQGPQRDPAEVGQLDSRRQCDGGAGALIETQTVVISAIDGHDRRRHVDSHRRLAERLRDGDVLHTEGIQSLAQSIGLDLHPFDTARDNIGLAVGHTGRQLRRLL